MSGGKGLWTLESHKINPRNSVLLCWFIHSFKHSFIHLLLSLLASLPSLLPYIQWPINPNSTAVSLRPQFTHHFISPLWLTSPYIAPFKNASQCDFSSGDFSAVVQAPWWKELSSYCCVPRTKHSLNSVNNWSMNKEHTAQKSGITWIS